MANKPVSTKVKRRWDTVEGKNLLVIPILGSLSFRENSYHNWSVFCKKRLAAGTLNIYKETILIVKTKDLDIWRWQFTHDIVCNQRSLEKWQVLLWLENMKRKNDCFAVYLAAGLDTNLFTQLPTVENILQILLSISKLYFPKCNVVLITVYTIPHVFIIARLNQQLSQYSNIADFLITGS